MRVLGFLFVLLGAFWTFWLAYDVTDKASIGVDAAFVVLSVLMVIWAGQNS